MTILYGDSTASTLETNFLEFLRDAVVFLVEVANASQGVGEQTEIAASRGRAASLDFGHLDDLERLVQRAVASAPNAPPDSAAARCAGAIAHAVTELTRAERNDVQSHLGRDIARTETEIAAHLQSCVRALEVLIARHDLPSSADTLHVRARIEAPFTAQLQCATLYGIAADIELEIPAGHLFAQPLRLDRVVDRLEIHAPDMSGWLQKTIKLKPQRLERYHLIELVIAPAAMRIKLRAMPDGSGDWFDLEVPPSPGHVSLVRIGEQGDALGEPTIPDEKQEDALLAVLDKLDGAAQELRMKRKRVIDARVDGEPMATIADPALIIDRLVGAMTPIVREIARHSLAADELVLKRMLEGGKREEYFVSVGELRAVLDKAPSALRGRFTPLGLDAGSMVPPAMDRKSVMPAPIPAPVVTPIPAPVVSPDSDEIIIEHAIASEPSVTHEEPEEVTIEISVSGLQSFPEAPPPPDPVAPPRRPSQLPPDPVGPPRPRLPVRPAVPAPPVKGRSGSS